MSSPAVACDKGVSRTKWNESFPFNDSAAQIYHFPERMSIHIYTADFRPVSLLFFSSFRFKYFFFPPTTGLFSAGFLIWYDYDYYYLSSPPPVPASRVPLNTFFRVPGEIIADNVGDGVSIYRYLPIIILWCAPTLIMYKHYKSCDAVLIKYRRCFRCDEYYPKAIPCTFKQASTFYV